MFVFMSFASVLLCIAVLVMFLSLLLAKKTGFNREKSSPFECGFDPNSGARVPFSLRFFLVTVIFLIFDVEIVLLLPFAFSSLVVSSLFWVISSLVFLVILIGGLLYEWGAGALEWAL